LAARFLTLGERFDIFLRIEGMDTLDHSPTVVTPKRSDVESDYYIANGGNQNLTSAMLFTLRFSCGVSSLHGLCGGIANPMNPS
jgi:hypothetical protein